MPTMPTYFMIFLIRSRLNQQEIADGRFIEIPDNKGWLTNKVYIFRSNKGWGAEDDLQGLGI
jgi:hypothetical protein